MSSIKMYESDLGVTINGVVYYLDHVASATEEDPERKRLIRGANASNKSGIIYSEGLREAKIWTWIVMDLSPELYQLLNDCFDDDTRIEPFIVSRVNGSKRVAKNAILSQKPKQLTLDDTAESLNVSLIFESYEITTEIKE